MHRCMQVLKASTCQATPACQHRTWGVASSICGGWGGVKMQPEHAVSRNVDSINRVAAHNMHHSLPPPYPAQNTRGPGTSLLTMNGRCVDRRTSVRTQHPSPTHPAASPPLNTRLTGGADPPLPVTLLLADALSATGETQSVMGTAPFDPVS